MSAKEHKCHAKVYIYGRSSPCGRGAKYEHEGDHYCGTHHPPKVAEKDAARKAKRDAERAAMETRHLAARALAAEMRHRAECFPVLLEALQWMVDNDDTITGDEPIERLGGRSWDEENAYWISGLNKARAAIDKALGVRDE